MESCVPVLHQSHLTLPVIASAVLTLVMQMVRKQQPTAAASTGARRGVTADAAAKSGCRMISAPRSAKEGTVVATSASASASGQTQGRTAAPAGLASRARGQTEGSVATANAVLDVSNHE